MPGLNLESGTVSFQSLEEPGSYLYNDNNILNIKSMITSTDNTTFIDQISFHVRVDKYMNDSVAFEYFNLTNYFIRQDSSMQLVVQEETGNDVTFQLDASFKIVYPTPDAGNGCFQLFLCYTCVVHRCKSYLMNLQVCKHIQYRFTVQQMKRNHRPSR